MNHLVESLQRLPQRRQEIWQGGLVRLPAWVQEPGDAEPWRPSAPLWVSTATQLVGLGDQMRPGENGYPRALAQWVTFAESTAQCRPGCVEVSDPVLAERLGRVLMPVGVLVKLSRRLPLVDRLLDEMAAEMEKDHGARMRIPCASSVPGVTEDHLRAFAEAAKEFYDAAPWRYLSSEEDILRIESQTPLPDLRYVSVMGMGGIEYGLAFFPSLGSIERMAEMGPEEFFTKHSGWSVDFDAIDMLPFRDADLFLDAGFPVAGPRAYPIAKQFGPRLKVHRPNAAVLAFFEGMLRALAGTSEAEMDMGRWTKTAATSDGPREFVLTLPNILDPDDARKARPLIPDPRLNDRMMDDLERLLAQQEFQSDEDMQRFLDENVRGKPIPHPPPDTPLEKARDLVHEAVQQQGRRRTQLARKALEICPDCADAYVLLAESEPDLGRARPLYEQAVAAGERALGPEVFQQDVGHFWGIARTRPYMRARLGLAETLDRMEDFEGAAGHYEELLRLNPNDNQGARDGLAFVLLRLEAWDRLQALFDRYPDDWLAEPLYVRALYAFKRSGDSPESRRALDKALKTNPHVPSYLLGEREFPEDLPDSCSPGDEDEAAVCADMLYGAWEDTPGALDWLKQRRTERK